MSKLVDGAQIYVVILSVSLLLSFIDGLIHTAAVVYYLSFLLILLYIIIYTEYIQPVYLYLVVLNIYVITTSAGLWLDLNEYFPIIKDFSQDIFYETFRIGLVAVLGLSFPLMKKYNYPLSGFYKPDKSLPVNKIFNYCILILIILCVLGEWAYALIHKEAFFEKYIFSYLRIEKESKVLFMPIAYLQFLIFTFCMLYVIYEPDWMVSKIFWLALVLFVVLHIRIGGRQGLVIVGLLLFWRIYIQYKIKWLQNIVLKLLSAIFIVFFLGIIVIIRQRTVEFSWTNLFINFTFEFGNALPAALNSVYFVKAGNNPPFFWVLLDPIIGLVPSFLVPEKKGWIMFENWVESIGGFDIFSPLGGVFLPGQLYLFTGSLIGVFLYFLFISVFFRKMYFSMRSGRKIDLMRGLSTSSLILIFSLRSEYWVQVKMILLWIGVFPVVSYLLSDILMLKGYKFNRATTAESL